MTNATYLSSVHTVSCTLQSVGTVVDAEQSLVSCCLVGPLCWGGWQVCENVRWEMAILQWVCSKRSGSFCSRNPVVLASLE